MLKRRHVLRSLLAAGATLPALQPTALLAQPADDPLLRDVHPELRTIARQILRYAGKGPPFSLATLPQARASQPVKAPAQDIPFARRQVPGGKGHPEVTVFAINAKPGGRRPAILHTHGGGFFSGSAESAIREMQDLCRALDCAAVTVDYRLAPETIWRGSIEDNYAALKWLHAHAEELGVDPSRIAVMGESAGGGHAALLAIAARDRGEVPIAFQCLTYPMLDDRTGSSRPVPPHVGRIIWTAEANRFGWRSFLGTAPGGRAVPSQAVPARNPRLAGLPPAFIGVGSIDLFCDEDTEYARRLNEAGVPTELIVVPGAFHGFDIMPVPTRVAAWFGAARLDALRRGLGIAAG